MTAFVLHRQFLLFLQIVVLYGSDRFASVNHDIEQKPSRQLSLGMMTIKLAMLVPFQGTISPLFWFFSFLG